MTSLLAKAKTKPKLAPGQPELLGGVTYVQKLRPPPLAFPSLPKKAVPEYSILLSVNVLLGSIESRSRTV